MRRAGGRCTFQMSFWRCARIKDHEGGHECSIRTACGAVDDWAAIAQMNRSGINGACLRTRGHSGEHAWPLGDIAYEWDGAADEDQVEPQFPMPQNATVESTQFLRGNQ